MKQPDDRSRRRFLKASSMLGLAVVFSPAVSAFPDEIYQAPRSWTEKAYPKLIHYNRLPKGTHFAAWEQPELFVNEVRASFKSLR
jgi:pimeloyl-ACP methyl ester carboxylesterase